MAIPDYMETKPVTHEVVPVAAQRLLGGPMSIRTTEVPSGQWLIGITDADGEVFMSATEAIAVAEFIATHVRKRWA